MRKVRAQWFLLPSLTHQCCWLRGSPGNHVRKWVIEGNGVPWRPALACCPQRTHRTERPTPQPHHPGPGLAPSPGAGYHRNGRQIIADSLHDMNPDDDDEIELDIDQLDNSTLWKLRAFCDAVRNKQLAQRPPAPAGAGGGGGATSAGGTNSRPAMRTESGSGAGRGRGLGGRMREVAGAWRRSRIVHGPCTHACANTAFSSVWQSVSSAVGSSGCWTTMPAGISMHVHACVRDERALADKVHGQRHDGGPSRGSTPLHSALAFKAYTARWQSVACHAPSTPMMPA